jgi:serine/threonine-protein kinase
MISQSATTRLTQPNPGGPVLTQYGMVMGTPGYMSPEQARGITVDKRTDVWAFGCILFEVLTGTKAFHGDTVSDCIAAVIDKEPDWSLIPVTTPNRLRELMRKCLTKEPRRRLRDIGDARIDIEDVLSQPMSGLYRAASADGTGPSRSRVVARMTLRLPDSAPLANTPRSSITLAPDGSSVAYVTGRAPDASLALRRMEETDARPIPGTQGAEQPFYSPDSQKLAFFLGGRLRRVPLSGGVPSVVAPAPRPQGATWDATDRIFFVPDWQAGIVRVPSTGVASPGGAAAAVGGEVETVAKPDIAQGHIALLAPDILPGGRSALASIWTGSSYDDALIAAIDLRTGAVRPLIQAGANPRFALSGHIVFTRKNAIYAVAFDPDRLDIFGQPQMMVDGVLANALGGGVQFAFNADGTLVYAPGPMFEPEATMLIAPRAGLPGAPDPHALIADNRPFVCPSLSPDSKRLAVQVQGPTDHIWIYDLERGGSPLRLTFQGDNSSPVWFPDDRRVAFAIKLADRQEIQVLSTDTGTTAQTLVSSQLLPTPCGVTPDGQALVYCQSRPQGGCELWAVRVGEPASACCVVQGGGGAGSAWGASLSPDGKFIAFVSDQTGRPEVYIQPFVLSGGGGQRWQVSRDGGSAPRWARGGGGGGGELYYRAGDSIIAVRIAFEPSFMVGRPRPMLEGKYVEPTLLSPNYDVFPDGDRVIVMRRADEPPPAKELCVVLNWFAELARRVPVPQVSRPSTSMLSQMRSGITSGVGPMGGAPANAATVQQPAPAKRPSDDRPPPAGGFNSSAGTLI